MTRLVYEFHFWALFIAPAIVALLDVLTGFSKWVAVRLKGRIRADAILLFEILIATAGVIWWFHHLDIPHGGFVDYIRWQDMEAQVARDKIAVAVDYIRWQDMEAQVARDKIAVAHAKEVAHIERIVWVIELSSAVACVLVAKLQRRNLILGHQSPFFPMSAG